MIWLLLGYMWLFLHRPFEIWPVLAEVHIERLYMAVCIVAAFLSQPRGRAGNRLHPSIAAYVAAVLLSWCLSPWSSEFEVQFRVIDWLKIVVFYFLVIRAVRTERDLGLLVAGFLVTSALFVGHSVWEFHHGRHNYGMGIVRMMGVNTALQHPNSLAATAVYSLCFVRPLWFAYQAPGIRVALAGYTALCGYTVIQTGSRSSLILLLSFLCLLMLTSRHKVRFLSLAFALMVLIFSLMPEDKKGRFLTLIDPSRGPANARVSADVRAEHLQLGIELWQHYPLTGAGPGALRVATGSPIVFHNLYGQALGELGLIGSVALGALLFAIYISASRSISAVRGLPFETDRFLTLVAEGLRNAVLLFLVAGFAGVSVFSYLPIWLAAFAGVTRLLAEQRSSSAGAIAEFGLLHPLNPDHPVQTAALPSG